MNQYLIHKDKVIARLVQPTALKEVFASPHWTWDGIANTNVLVNRVSCKVSSSRRLREAAANIGHQHLNAAYPLPGGVAWEFLILAR